MKCALLLFLFIVIPCSVFAARDLTDTAFVNITSDTSSTAKKMAMGEASRQIISNALSPFIIDNDKFKDLMQNAKDDDLNNLISSVNIDDEKQSSITYSASIKMTLDNASVKKWLRDNYVNNWLDSADAESKDKISVVIVLNNGLQDWIEFNNAISAIDINVNQISNRQVSVNISLSSRSDFMYKIKETGWKYSENSDIIKIWK